MAVAHADPEMVGWARRWSDRYPVHMDERPRLMGSASLGSTVAVPMTAGAKIVGVLMFGNDPGSRSFDQSDLTIAEEIARRAGIAVENARLAGEQPTSRESCNAACGRRSSGDARVRGGNHVPAGWRVNKWAATSMRHIQEGGWMLASGT